MTALVTGAAGFIGEHLVQALVADGQHVRAAVRTGGERSELDHLAGVEIVEADLTNERALVRALKGCDTLYHLAALYATEPDTATIARLYAVNVGGTKLLLHLAGEAGVEKIVVTSTVGTLGRPVTGEPPDERTAFNLWESASHYVKSKYLAEQAADVAADAGQNVVIVHPCAPVGPGDRKPTASGARVLNYLKGVPISYPPGGINWVAVEDVAHGHILAARYGERGGHYILGNSVGNLTLAEFEKMMIHVSGIYPARHSGATLYKRLRKWTQAAEPAAGGVQPVALTANPSLAISQLRLPQTPLIDAFRASVAWYRANGYT